MMRFKFSKLTTAIAISALAVVATTSAHSQPMMGEMNMLHDSDKMQERMAKHKDMHQAELKSKLHLTEKQEPAWKSFVENMSFSNTQNRPSIDREGMAKLTTPERIEKMNAWHEANFALMQKHLQQRFEATRQFYGQLTADQKKIFDDQTLPPMGYMNGKNKNR
jgi:Spy/CpxP family protein refolding chaperone